MVGEFFVRRGAGGWTWLAEFILFFMLHGCKKNTQEEIRVEAGAENKKIKKNMARYQKKETDLRSQSVGS